MWPIAPGADVFAFVAFVARPGQSAATVVEIEAHAFALRRWRRGWQSVPVSRRVSSAFIATFGAASVRPLPVSALAQLPLEALDLLILVGELVPEASDLAAPAAGGCSCFLGAAGSLEEGEELHNFWRLHSVAEVSFKLCDALTGLGLRPRLAPDCNVCVEGLVGGA